MNSTSTDATIGSILILDDDQFALKFIAGQLAILGFTDVLLFDDGESALNRVDGEVGLIMCDLQMPKMDGVEFVRKLGQLNYTGNLILLSGENTRTLSAAGELAREHKLNVNGVLQKPVKLEDIRPLLYRSRKDPSAVVAGGRKPYSAEELRVAIDESHLFNVYQPKVCVKTGAFTGVEALVRWQHPEDGMVFPDQFITLAEDASLIDALTKTVLTQAAQDRRRWSDAGLDLAVAVNISMNNLTLMDFPELVTDICDQAGMPIAALCLEITESKSLVDAKQPLDILTRLRLKGVNLSIDDFGTGHSSLVQLRSLPFDELKLDRSFVHGAANDNAQRVIFRFTVEMARELGLKTVAEGVEDLNDWNFVRDSGVDFVQGYFVAKPMPESELSTWLGEWVERYPELLDNN